MRLSPGLIRAASLSPTPLIGLMLRPIRLFASGDLSACFTWPRLEGISEGFMGSWIKSAEGLHTGRFIVIFRPVEPAEIGVQASSWEELCLKAIGWLKEFSESLESASTIDEIVKVVTDRFSGVRDREVVKIAIHEILHDRLIRGTTYKHLLEISSWGERLLSAHIAELAHRRLGIPRSPEEVWKGGLEDPVGYVKGLEDKVERLAREVLQPLKNFMKALFFQIFHTRVFGIFGVEIPTWAILLRKGLIDEEEYYRYFESEAYFPENDPLNRDGRLTRLAEELSDKLLRLNDPEEIASAAKKLLSPPLEEVARAHKTAYEEGVERILDMFEDRIKNLENMPIERPETLTTFRIVKHLSSVYERFETTLKIILEIFATEKNKELVKKVFSQLATPYPGYGITMYLKCGDGEEPVTYNPWTMREDIWVGKYVSERSGRKYGQFEDLVGSTPRVLRGYVYLREGLRSRGRADAKEILKEYKLKIPDEIFEKYIDGLRAFRYKGLENYRELGVEDAVDILSGWVYTFASLGEHSVKISGFHGRYLL